MHHTKPLALICFMLSAFMWSCKKDHSPAPPPEVLDSLHINLNYPTSQQSANSIAQYELIISETGGKVLLDTLTPYNTPIAIWLKTNQKLLDITTVRLWATTNSYLIHSYKAIDLTAWVNIPDNDSIQLPSGGTNPPPPVNGLMTIMNVDVPFLSYYNLLAGGRGDSRSSNGRIIYGQYTASPGDYAYLIFPALGLYNIHRITSAYDTIDFSKPDTAVTIQFNKPAIYTTSGFDIAGYPDPNDLMHTVNLDYFKGPGTPIPDATDLVYPGKKGFKKYYFSYYVSDGVNNNYATVNLPYTDTVPVNLPIPDPSWYNVSLSTDTTISVNFNTHKPTYYDVTAHIGDIQFTLTASGDSTRLRPAAFLAALKSRLLGNTNINAMRLDVIKITTDAEPSYLAYWVKRTQIYQAWKEPGEANSIFQRHF